MSVWNGNGNGNENIFITLYVLYMTYNTQYIACNKKKTYYIYTVI